MAVTLRRNYVVLDSMAKNKALDELIITFADAYAKKEKSSTTFEVTFNLRTPQNLVVRGDKLVQQFSLTISKINRANGHQLN